MAQAITQDEMMQAYRECVKWAAGEIADAVNEGSDLDMEIGDSYAALQMQPEFRSISKDKFSRDIRNAMAG